MKNILLELLPTQPKVGEVTFIAVDGHAGSGKSTLAKLLAEKLEAEIIHTDDFSGWDNPLNWWPNVIKEVFEPIKTSARLLSYQTVSWWENHHPAPVENQPITKIMILEGVSSSRKEFDDFISYRIFVDTPKHICFERGLARDTGTGKTKEELNKIWEEWFKEEEEYIRRDNPKAKADLVIDGTKPLEDQISFEVN
jgi:uridine kinase